MVRWRLEVGLRSSLLIGGQVPALIADVATARDAAGRPIVPASALKGAIRIEAERLVRLLGEPVCGASTPGDLCPPGRPCLVCRTFGGVEQPAKVRFGNAVVDPGFEPLFTARHAGQGHPTGRGYGVRPGVTISRRRRAAAEDRLFFAETLAPFIGQDGSGIVFGAEVEALEPLSDDERRLFELAVGQVRAIGRGKSRGLGWVELTLRPTDEPAPEAGADRPTGEELAARGALVELTPAEYLRPGRRGSVENVLDTRPFVPGGTIRGAVATWIARRAAEGWGSPVIVDGFLGEGAAHFGDANPTTLGEAWPVPRSAATCKAYPGFVAGSAGETTSHGTIDRLIAAALAELLRRTGLPVLLVDRCRVDGCGADLRPAPAGWCYWGPHEIAVGLDLRLHTKTAVNRRRLTAADGQLYSYELLDPRLDLDQSRRPRFVGRVSRIAPGLGERLAELDGEVLDVGGARSRGYGRVRVRVRPASDDPIAEAAARLDQFVEAIRRPLAELGIAELPLAEHDVSRVAIAERLFFALTLRSDLLLPLGNPLARLAGAVAAALGLETARLRLEKAFAAGAEHGGYNQALGLPKDIRWGLARGSAFLFSCDAAARDRLLAALPGLLGDGLGSRREEGCGRVSFCDPFHLERTRQV